MAYLFRFYLLGCCSLNVFKEFSGNPSSFENVFKGLFLTLFSYQGSCRYRPASATHSVYHTFQCLSTVFLFSFDSFCRHSKEYHFFPSLSTLFTSRLFLFRNKRRRRDLNPRAAINDLHPFQGCPFSHLGYFSRALIY